MQCGNGYGDAQIEPCVSGVYDGVTWFERPGEQFSRPLSFFEDRYQLLKPTIRPSDSAQVSDPRLSRGLARRPVHHGPMGKGKTQTSQRILSRLGVVARTTLRMLP